MIDVPRLLHQYGIRPDKRLGQNFLINPGSLTKVIEAAEIQPQDAVLEIGAGIGNLTILLAARARSVVAVELDARMVSLLRQVTSPYPNIQVLEGDILAMQPSRLFRDSIAPFEDYLVVANLPYYITSAVIRHLLEADPPPRRLTLTVQKEVAERMCASAGEMSLLSLSVQIYGKPHIATTIPAGAFYPPPKVDSAVVRVDIYPTPVITTALVDILFFLAKAGFSQKRKTLRNSLSAGTKRSTHQVDQMLNQARISPQRRAQTLSLEEWGKLAEVFWDDRVSSAH